MLVVVLPLLDRRVLRRDIVATDIALQRWHQLQSKGRFHTPSMAEFLFETARIGKMTTRTHLPELVAPVFAFTSSGIQSSFPDTSSSSSVLSLRSRLTGLSDILGCCCCYVFCRDGGLFLLIDALTLSRKTIFPPDSVIAWQDERRWRFWNAFHVCLGLFGHTTSTTSISQAISTMSDDKKTDTNNSPSWQTPSTSSSAEKSPQETGDKPDQPAETSSIKSKSLLLLLLP